MRLFARSLTPNTARPVRTAAGPELIEKLVKRWPEHEAAIQQLADTDPTGNSRWLDWSVKQVRQGAPVEDLIELVRDAYAARDALKDLTQFPTADDARAALEALNPAAADESGGPQVVYNRDGWRAVEVFTQDQLHRVYPGSHDAWCVGWTDAERDYWTEYTERPGWRMYLIFGPSADAPFLAYFGAHGNETKTRGNRPVSAEDRPKIAEIAKELGIENFGPDEAELEELMDSAIQACANWAASNFEGTEPPGLTWSRSLGLIGDFSDAESYFSHEVQNYCDNVEDLEVDLLSYIIEDPYEAVFSGSLEDAYTGHDEWIAPLPEHFAGEAANTLAAWKQHWRRNQFDLKPALKQLQSLYATYVDEVFDGDDVEFFMAMASASKEQVDQLVNAPPEVREQLLQRFPALRQASRGLRITAQDLGRTAAGPELIEKLVKRWPAHETVRLHTQFIAEDKTTKKPWREAAQRRKAAMLGYKIMLLSEDKQTLVSLANNQFTFPARIGSAVHMPGKGIYMANDKEFVLDYYSGDSDNEVLVTFSFDPDDIITGNLTDRITELSVPSAVIVGLQPLGSVHVDQADPEDSTRNTGQPVAGLLPYQGQCDVLRRGNPGGEQFWREMMQNAQPITLDDLAQRADVSRILDEDETLEEFVCSDAEAQAYSSTVDGQPVCFLQTRGFEFIFATTCPRKDRRTSRITAQDLLRTADDGLRQASRALKKRLKGQYALIADAMALDQGASTQYSQVIERLLAQYSGGVSDEVLAKWNHQIKEADAAWKTLRQQPRLDDNIHKWIDANEVPSYSHAFTSVTNKAIYDAAEFGKAEDAEVVVLSPDIVETINFEAACRLHGAAAPKSQQRAWCGGNAAVNFANYANEARRRFLVYPDGPTKLVTVGPHEKVPFSTYAFAVSVNADGSLYNINDSMNRYVDKHKDFDRDGANKALAILNAQLGLRLKLEEVQTTAKDHQRDVLELNVSHFVESATHYSNLWTKTAFLFIEANRKLLYRRGKSDQQLISIITDEALDALDPQDFDDAVVLADWILLGTDVYELPDNPLESELDEDAWELICAAWSPRLHDPVDNRIFRAWSENVTQLAEDYLTAHRDAGLGSVTKALNFMRSTTMSNVKTRLDELKQRLVNEGNFDTDEGEVDTVDDQADMLADQGRSAALEDGPAVRAAVEQTSQVIAQIETQWAALGSGDTSWIPPQFSSDLAGAKYKLFRHGARWADTVITTKSIPPKQHKAVEMAARLFARASAPKDYVKWFRANERRLALLVEAIDWPERSVGGDDDGGDDAGKDGAEAFPLGGFEVHNTVGASGQTLANTKAVIEQAAAGLTRAGLGAMAYGPLYLVGQVAHENHAAWYKPTEDAVYLRPLVRGSSVEESARHLIHELAHRYWAKEMDAEAKKTWAAHHKDLTYRKLEVTTPEVGAPIPHLIVNRKPAAFGGFENNRAVILNAKDGSRIGLVDRWKLHEWLRESARLSLFPTSYAAKDYEEHFCDAVSLAAQGKLTGEHLEALGQVLGSVRTAARRRQAESIHNLKELDQGRMEGPMDPFEDWVDSYDSVNAFEEQSGVHLGAFAGWVRSAAGELVERAIDQLAGGDYGMRSQLEEAARSLYAEGYEDDEVVEALKQRRMKQKLERDEQSLEGAFYLGQRGAYDVYRIDSHSAAVTLGTPAWCIVRDVSIFDSYKEEGAVFEFYVPKEGPPAAYAREITTDAEGRKVVHVFGADDEIVLHDEPGLTDLDEGSNRHRDVYRALKDLVAEYSASGAVSPDSQSAALLRSRDVKPGLAAFVIRLWREGALTQSELGVITTALPELVEYADEADAPLAKQFLAAAVGAGPPEREVKADFIRLVQEVVNAPDPTNLDNLWKSNHNSANLSGLASFVPRDLRERASKVLYWYGHAREHLGDLIRGFAAGIGFDNYFSEIYDFPKILAVASTVVDRDVLYTTLQSKLARAGSLSAFLREVGQRSPTEVTDELIEPALGVSADSALLATSLVFGFPRESTQTVLSERDAEQIAQKLSTRDAVKLLKENEKRQRRSAAGRLVQWARRPWVCVDLDGTLLSYEPGDAAHGQFGDVLPGAADALRELASLGWRITIYTARFDTADAAALQAIETRETIEDILRKAEVPFDDVWIGPKPRCDWFIDDRALHFDGDWASVLEQLVVGADDEEDDDDVRQSGNALIDTVDSGNDFEDGGMGSRRDRSIQRPPGLEAILH